MPTDNVFQMAASNIRFGAGCTGEIGMDLRDMAVKRTMVLIDPNLRESATADVVIESLKRERIGFDLFDDIEVEPTDTSFQWAAEAATMARTSGSFSMSCCRTVMTTWVSFL